MEEGVRRIKGAKRNSSRTESTRPMYERRPLKSVSLAPPEYKVAPQLLLESYVEKEIRFLGVVPHIPIDLDATNRTDVLRAIDRGKREEKIPWVTNYENDAVFFLNIQNVKISRRDGKEELLLRLAIHEIAAICYIRDGEQHILGIKFGDFGFNQCVREDTQEMCQLAVLYCDSKTSAEELCSLIGQCFQLVYTEATMQFLDMKLSEAAAGLSIGSSTTRSDKSSSSTPKKDYDHKNLAFLSQSSLDLNQGNGTISSGTSRSLSRSVRRGSITRSEGDLSPAVNEIIQNYMKKLHTKLNPEELRKFAHLLKALHSGMPFHDYCEQVLDLYGPDRKHLLAEMKPFIQDKDSAVYFETFLERVGIFSGGNGRDTMSTTRSRVYRRTSSGTSMITSTGDDYDQMMSDISHDIENLGTNLEMKGGGPDMFLPKTT